MAKVNITFKDRADGKVSFRVTTHPPMRHGDTPTPAQRTGEAILRQLQQITQHSQGQPQVVDDTRTS